jgi:hypothetical protein
MEATSSPIQSDSRVQITALRANRKISGAWLCWYLFWGSIAAIAVLSATSFGQSFLGRFNIFLCAGLTALAILQNKRVALDFSLRKLCILFLLLFCSAQSHMKQIRQWAPRFYGADFSAYYIAAKALDGHGQTSLYCCLPKFPDGRMNLNAFAPKGSAWAEAQVRYGARAAYPFIYPPTFAVLVRPLAWLPLSFNGVFLVWDALMLVLLAASVLLAVSAAGQRLSPPLLLILAVGVSSTYPVIDSLIQGQADILILFLLSLSLWLITRARWTASALPLCAAALLKLTPLLCLPVLAVQRRWRWLVAFAAWTAVLLGFSVWQVGWNLHAAFWHAVLPTIGAGAPVVANQSISALVQELFLGNASYNSDQPAIVAPHVILLSRVVAALVYGSVLVRIVALGKRCDLAASFVAITLVTLAISPISWVHHYTIALLPLLFLWARGNVVAPRLLLLLWFVVASNVFVFLSFLFAVPSLRLLFAAVAPILVIAVAHAALRPTRDPLEAAATLPTGGELPAEC